MSTQKELEDMITTQKCIISQAEELIKKYKQKLKLRSFKIGQKFKRDDGQRLILIRDCFSIALLDIDTSEIINGFTKVYDINNITSKEFEQTYLGVVGIPCPVENW